MPVLDLAMSIGERLLVSGMSANDVVVQMLRVTRAYGLSSVHVDLTYTSIGVTHHRGPTRRPLSMVRIVQPVVVDYSKAREISRLLTRVEAGLGIVEARAAYDEIFWAPPPYARWIALLGSGGIAAGVSLTFSASWLLALISFAAGTGAESLLRWLHARRVPPFFAQATVAGGMTMVAAGVHQLGRRGVPLFEDMDPTLIVVGGIVMLLAGVMIVGAVQDAIDQFYVTASARLLEVVMRTGGIVAGILMAVRVLDVWDVSFLVVNQTGLGGVAVGAVRRRRTDLALVRRLLLRGRRHGRPDGAGRAARLRGVRRTGRRGHQRGRVQHHRRARRGRSRDPAGPGHRRARVRDGERGAAAAGARPRPAQRAAEDDRRRPGEPGDRRRGSVAVPRASSSRSASPRAPPSGPTSADRSTTSCDGCGAG